MCEGSRGDDGGPWWKNGSFRKLLLVSTGKPRISLRERYEVYCNKEGGGEGKKGGGGDYYHQVVSKLE